MMVEWARWLEAGGATTYILLFVAPAVVGAGLLHVVLRRRVSLCLLALLIAAAFGIGLSSTGAAHRRVDNAIGMAHPAERAILAIRGYEEASHPWHMAFAIVGGGLVFLIAGEIGRAHRRVGR
jgi:hypothetical protein